MSSNDRPEGRSQPGDIAHAISRHIPREEYTTVVWRLFEGTDQPTERQEALLVGVLQILLDIRVQLGASYAVTR